MLPLMDLNTMLNLIRAFRNLRATCRLQAGRDSMQARISGLAELPAVASFLEQLRANSGAVSLAALIAALHAMSMELTDTTNGQRTPLAAVVLGLHNVLIQASGIDSTFSNINSWDALLAQGIARRLNLNLAFGFPIGDQGVWTTMAWGLGAVQLLLQRVVGARLPAMSPNTQAAHLILNRVLLSWVLGRRVGVGQAAGAFVFHYALSRLEPFLFQQPWFRRWRLRQAAQNRNPDNQPSRSATNSVEVQTDRSYLRDSALRGRGAPRGPRGRAAGRPRCSACGR